MDKTNKFYKILRIIFLTLAIISIVFTLCKKVGLCASVDQGQNIFSSYLPIPIGQGYGYNSNVFVYSSDMTDYIVNQLHTDSSSSYLFNNPNYEVFLVSLREVNPNTNIVSFCVYGCDMTKLSFGTSDNSGKIRVTSSGSGGDYYQWYFNYNYSTNTWVNWYYNGGYSFALDIYGQNCPFSDVPSGSGYAFSNNVNFSNYPLYADDSLTFPNGDLVFYYPSVSGPNYESIEGTVSDIFNYTEIISGVAEDMTTPTLFVRLYQWLLGIQQTIYGGFNTIWQNFRSLFKPMIDNISNFFQWFHDKYTEFFNFIYDKWLELFDALGLTGNQTLADFLDYLELIYNFLIGQGNVTLQDVIEGALDGLFGNNGKLAHIKEIFDWFYTHGLKNGEFDFVTLWDYLFEYDEQVVYSQLKTSRYGAFVLSCKTEMTSFFTALTSVTAADHVQFTIPIGTTLGGVQIPDIVIDFDWYADIRDTFLPWFMAFLYISVIWCFWKSLPNIIHGVAGDVSTFTDALGGDEFAPTSHGLFTHGVSHNQPSLDKAPLSGGGGVHSGSSQFWY